VAYFVNRDAKAMTPSARPDIKLPPSISAENDPEGSRLTPLRTTAAPKSPPVATCSGASDNTYYVICGFASIMLSGELGNRIPSETGGAV
jgi:hypothetical protein